ncbi:hypothetical protein [Bifidobacterium hapali]|uniref:hypothetical protein n=1 Tax=Bifidobacterium hapali TaxID=1630172 RepID=UPI0013039FD2|nr:hypothetical protein [Bifidobacterium hapali]
MTKSDSSEQNELFQQSVLFDSLLSITLSAENVMGVNDKRGYEREIAWVFLLV